MTTSYCDSCDDTSQNSASEHEHPVAEDRTLTTHARVFAAADKFQVHDLKRYARRRFLRFLNEGANTADVLEAIKVAYSTTPESVRELRDVIIDHLTEPENGLFLNPDIKAGVGSMSQVCLEVANRLFEKYSATRGIPAGPSSASGGLTELLD